MDTCGYVYPPMDDHLRGITVTTVIWLARAWMAVAFADGLQPKQGQGDVGSGLELERSWRGCCSRGLAEGEMQLPVENWLTGAVSADLTSPNGIQHPQGKELTNLRGLCWSLMHAPISGSPSARISLKTPICC